MKNIKLTKLSSLYAVFSVILFTLVGIVPDSLAKIVMQKLAILLAFIAVLFFIYVAKDGNKTIAEMDELHVSEAMFEKGLRSEIWSFRVALVAWVAMLLFADVIF